MSFLDVKRTNDEFDIEGFLRSVDCRRVEAALGRSRPGVQDFLALLSDAAVEMLETMAQTARALTRRHFGNVIQLFTPLYISNYCENACQYCSFARQYRIKRRHLSLDQIAAEAQQIHATGMRHVLVLTGESRVKASPQYLRDAVRALRAYFPGVGIEIYPLTKDEYAALIAEGVNALTLYQEVYDEAVYARLHASGPKADYGFRLEAPERACAAGMHAVTVGPLLGLADWRRELYCTALHLDYLQRTYPAVEMAVSLPRMRPLVSEFAIEHPVDDRRFVQILTALRIVFPTVGIVVSTRESQRLRDAVVPMGVTRMSAGVSTAVGGRAGASSTVQFEIADMRDVSRMKDDLLRMGYQPVMHDWHHSFTGAG